MTASVPTHVIGASGRSGAALCRSLAANQVPVAPVVRDPARFTALPNIEPLVADLRDPSALQAALAGARRIVSCAHARHAPAILAAAPGDARLVFLGSTRKFTRWPDAHALGVLAGEQAFLASGRNGVMLHPTMIYGAQGEDNVQRLAAVLRRIPIAPLPGGGQALVQPIHQNDVTRAIQAALDRDWAGPRSMVIAGPEPVRYADFVRAVAAAAGLRVRIVVAPAGLLMAGAWLTRALPFWPAIGADEVRRLLEDKAFSIQPMIAELGLLPTPLEAGLALTFNSKPKS